MRDSLARECFKGNKNTIISWLLMAFYAYYVLDNPILSDGVYDGMCKWLLENYDVIEHHHKYLISKEDLQNGSLFSIGMIDYPIIVRNATEQLLKEIDNEKL